MNIFLIQNLNGMDVFFRIVQILFVLFITILVFNEITILKGFILVILLILYNSFPSFIYKEYNPSCDYYKIDSNKPDKCKELSVSVCNDFNDNKEECLKSCYYIDTTVSEDIPDGNEKTNLINLKKCVPIDDKCNSISCSSFQPTNAFEECCKLSESGCTQDKIDQGLEDAKSEIDELKESNRTPEGRVGEYGIESGEKQIIYEYCSKDM